MKPRVLLTGWWLSRVRNSWCRIWSWSDAAQLVAEQHQALAEKAHEAGRLLGGQLLRHSDRVPVAPQHLAAWRAGAHLSKKFVFFLRQHHGAFLSPWKVG